MLRYAQPPYVFRIARLGERKLLRFFAVHLPLYSECFLVIYDIADVSPSARHTIVRLPRRTLQHLRACKRARARAEIKQPVDLCGLRAGIGHHDSVDGDPENNFIITAILKRIRGSAVNA